MFLYCHCANTALTSPAVRTAALEELLRRREPFLATADLCELAAVQPSLLRGLLTAGSTVAACHARAMRWILEFAGVQAESLRWIDLRGGDPQSLVAELAGMLPASTFALPTGLDAPGLRLVVCLMAGRPDVSMAEQVLASGWSILFVPTIQSLPALPRPVPVLGDFGAGFPAAGPEAIFLDIAACTPQQVVEALAATQPGESAPPSWLPWFPVIDYSRCTACGQCRNFCLFGVYGQQEGRVVVERPGQCKPHCPACGRVCPACAIIFPKFNQPPINGAEVRPEHLAGQMSPEQARKAPPADVMAALRKRQEEHQRAIDERRKCSSPESKPSPDNRPGPSCPGPKAQP